MDQQPRLSRRDRRRLYTREEILAAARELLLEVGPEALSLRQVARRADFSPAALYTYFSSRDEIVASLFAESFERLDAYLRRVPTDLPPAERVVELGMAYMDFGRDNPMDLRCILSATSQESAALERHGPRSGARPGSSARPSGRGSSRESSPAASGCRPRRWPTASGLSSTGWSPSRDRSDRGGRRGVGGSPPRAREFVQLLMAPRVPEELASTRPRALESR